MKVLLGTLVGVGGTVMVLYVLGRALGLELTLVPFLLLGLGVIVALHVAFGRARTRT